MYHYVNSSVLNLFEKPDNKSQVVSQALYGARVPILETFGDYAKIATADLYQGWVEKKDLYEGNTPRFTEDSVVATVIHNAVHLYEEPTVKKQKPLLTLPFEIHLEVVAQPEDEDFRWLQVKLIDGTLAWIARANVRLGYYELDMQEVLQLSKQFLGLPYTWGGISSFGYDCSGYIQMLFRQMGVALPRDAKDQFQDENFSAIGMDEIAAGDVIFFGESQENITHLGLCLGKNHMIHATARTAPILQVTRLNNAALAERYHYRAVRRLKGQQRQ